MFKIQIPIPHQRLNESYSWEGGVQEYAVVTSFLVNSYVPLSLKVLYYFNTPTSKIDTNR